MNINLKLNMNDNSIDTIKYFLLYFDTVNVYIPSKIYDSKQKCFKNILCNTDLYQQLLYLENENLISFQFDSPILPDKKAESDFESLIAGLILKHSQEIYKSSMFTYNHDTDILTISKSKFKFNSETSQFVLNCLTKDNYEMPSTFGYLYIFEFIASAFFDLYGKQNIATNCTFLNNLLYHYYYDAQEQKSNAYIHNYIVHDCLELLLPNIPSLSVEDILEIKYKARDELLELKSYIDNFSTNTIKYDIKSSDFCDLTKTVQNSLNQSIDCFNRKCQNMKYDIAQKFITEIKNPLSYSPLLLSLYQNIPAHIELLASLLFISSNVLLEYFKKLNDVKNDPLYFTYKISKYFK